MPVIGWGLASRALKPTTPMSLRYLKRKKLQQLIIITINLLPSVNARFQKLHCSSKEYQESGPPIINYSYIFCICQQGNKFRQLIYLNEKLYYEWYGTIVLQEIMDIRAQQEILHLA